MTFFAKTGRADHARATPPPHEDQVVLGMAAGMGAFFMFTVMNLFAKLLSETHSVIEISFYRNVIASVPFLIMVFAFGRRDILVIRHKPKLLATRAILGTVTLATTFAAYALMPMADTTALLFTTSLYVPILSVLFLKEQVGRYRWAAVVIGFAGVLLMVRPTGGVYALGVTVAMSAALLQGVMAVLLRHIGRHETPETVTFYFFLVGTFLTALALPFVAVTPTVTEIPLLLGVGLSGAAAQWLLSAAYRNAPAAIVTVFNYSSIVWATLFGWLIWGEWPLPAVLGGAAIVIASNILIIWRESRQGRVRPAAIEP